MTSEIIEKPMGAECTMKQYEAIPDSDFVENREYQLTDYPDNGANATQMAFALTCQRLFPAGTVITFSGKTDSNYTNGHLYQIQIDDAGAKSWKDITPVTDISSLQAQIPKIISNTIVSNWVEDTTYSDFGYKADISITDLYSNDVCEVIFNQTDASSGNYAQVNSSGAGTLTIYSKVNTEITIPTIIIIKGGN